MSSEATDNTTFAITEGVSGLWHYHLSKPDTKHLSLCMRPTMPTRMKAPADWKKPFGEHFPKRPTWCEICERKAR